MNDKPFDKETAHKFFSADCFNNCWTYIDKGDKRTDEDNNAMIQIAHASLWHWTQRPDCTEKNLSIGYWQLSRVYALIDDASCAKKYGEMCLETSPSDEPFFMGYAQEALARAAKVGGDQKAAAKHLAEARKYAEKVEDEQDKKLLDDDLSALQKN